MDNILLLRKPKGVTSFDVIRALRRELGIKKMGHAGTLDPLATGLLIIGINEGTKKLKDFIGLSKEYIAEIKLGTKTDSGDMEGNILEEQPVSEISEEKIKKALKEMERALELPVPVYSAVKRGGKPLYKYAREGKEITPPIKKMEVYEAELLKKEKNILSVRFSVSSGTYVRSLAEELAKRLGTIGTLQNLIRTRIGEFKLEDARDIEIAPRI